MNNQNKQQSYPQKQKGMGFIGLIMIIGLAVTVIFTGFKIAPPFIEQQKVRFAQESVAAQIGASQKSRSELANGLMKRLTLDDVDGLDGRNISINKENGQWEIRVMYERRIAYLDQVDVVIKYDKTVVVPE